MGVQAGATQAAASLQFAGLELSLLDSGYAGAPSETYVLTFSPVTGRYPCKKSFAEIRFFPSGWTSSSSMALGPPQPTNTCAPLTSSCAGGTSSEAGLIA